jgi:hypothetical protein
MPIGSQNGFAKSSDDDQGQYIDNWRRGAIKWTSSITVSQYPNRFCIMVNSIETNSTNSTKSSVISGKALSLKKSVQKGVKAIARPFKKLKKSISTASTRSIRSRSSTTFSDYVDESSINGQGDGGRSEPEVELTPQEQLSKSSVIISSSILIISTLEELQEHWRSPIYAFFKPDVVFQYHDDRPSHFFTCAAPKCKVRAGGVRRYQDSKDKSSTANLKHHALRCFGEDAVNAVIAGKEHSNGSRGILALFARKGKQPVKSTQTLKSGMSLYFILIYEYKPLIIKYSARLVKWLTENNRPINIINYSQFF